MWFYYRDLHSVVAVEADGERVAGAIDLGEAGHKAATSSRAIRAIDRAEGRNLALPVEGFTSLDDTYRPWDLSSELSHGSA